MDDSFITPIKKKARLPLDSLSDESIDSKDNEGREDLYPQACVSSVLAPIVVNDTNSDEDGSVGDLGDSFQSPELISSTKVLPNNFIIPDSEEDKTHQGIMDDSIITPIKKKARLPLDSLSDESIDSNDNEDDPVSPIDPKESSKADSPSSFEGFGSQGSDDEDDVIFSSPHAYPVVPSLKVRDDLYPQGPVSSAPAPIVIDDTTSDEDWSVGDLGDSFQSPELISATKVLPSNVIIPDSEEDKTHQDDISPFLLGRRGSSGGESDTPCIVLDEQEIKEMQTNREQNESGPSFAVRTKQTTDRGSITPRRKEELINESLRLSHLRQKAITEYKEFKIKHEMEKNSLPDGGLNMLHTIKKSERNIVDISERLAFNEKKIKTSKVEEVIEIDHSFTSGNNELPMSGAAISSDLGRRALEQYNTQKAITEDALKRLHKGLETYDDVLIEPSSKLKVPLKPHQVTALSWLVMREKQKYPCGGILADDMGLGKTLTMLALILYSLESSSSRRSDGSSDENDSGADTSSEAGGTLVVCPTSVMGQWECEIKGKIKCGALSFVVHHGTKRERRASRLALNDVVLTTYSILQKEASVNNLGPLVKVKWERIILDESHIIRNHKTLTSKATFLLNGNRRWCLTGTPIQNKVADLYAVFKFLKVQPFDDHLVFKNWIANNDSAGQNRLNCVMKSIMLRRTKEGINKDGGLGLKQKNIEIVNVKLTPEETAVYEEVALFSKAVFSQFITLKAEKQHLLEHGFPVLKKGKDLPKDNPFEKHPELNRLFGKLSQSSQVDSIHILLLLLRLRQICCHTSLITKMLEKDEIGSDNMAVESNFKDEEEILAKMNRLSLHPNELHDNEDKEEKDKPFLSLSNPVFDKSRESSKLKCAVKHLEEKVLPEKDKALIISQFTSVLDLIKPMLKARNIKFTSLTGSTPVQDRGNIIDQFNNNKNGPQVMLLSLQSGGTGLNLVGANHILFIDPHWNPQLERQAFDRVYRIGQTKDVYIYKFICDDTIEENILKLQENKIAIADAVLAGSKAIASQKLTLEDLKLLFKF